MWQAIAGAGAGLLGTFGQLFANERLQENQFMHNVEQVRRQNEYNSPVAQMQRYRDAGLNPNLIYGNISSGNQTEIARYQAPQVSGLPELLQRSVSDAMHLSLQDRQADADINLKAEQAYANKMLALGYQQDYYTKLLDNMLKSEIVGVNPGLIMTDEEIQSVRNSRGLARYDAEVASTNARTSEMEVRTALLSMQEKQQKWVYDNMNAIELEILQLKRDGLKYDNIVKQIYSEFEQEFSSIGGSGTLKFFLNFVRGLVGMFVPNVSRFTR